MEQTFELCQNTPDLLTALSPLINQYAPAVAHTAKAVIVIVRTSGNNNIRTRHCKLRHWRFWFGRRCFSLCCRIRFSFCESTEGRRWSRPRFKLVQCIEASFDKIGNRWAENCRGSKHVQRREDILDLTHLPVATRSQGSAS